jgi:hypothetical protein
MQPARRAWSTRFSHVSAGHLVLPEGVVEVGSNAFKRCSNITNVTFPSTLTRIGDEAFADCDRLDTVTLPIGVSGGTLGKKIFKGSPTKVFLVMAVTGKTAGGDTFNATARRLLERQVIQFYALLLSKMHARVS